jgi:hypothetical protein
LTYCEDVWIAVTTKGTGYTDQTYFYSSLFTKEQIDEYWIKGYKITRLCHRNDSWGLIMTKEMIM